MLARCRQLTSTGVDILLVREKQLPAGALVAFCRRIRAVGGAAKVLVSGRVDVALAAGLDGVHLSAAVGELTPAQVKRLMPEAWVSVSCHTIDEVRRAAEAGADAVLFGPVFGKTIAGAEVVAGVGLDALRQACRAAGKVPVFALGGVDAANARACEDAGAGGIAAIRMFFGTPGGAS